MKHYDTLIVDLDGTLAISKQSIDAEMSEILSAATKVLNIVVITGGAFPQLEKQVLARLSPEAHLERLTLLPTSGSSMRTFNAPQQKWEIVYEKALTEKEKDIIITEIHAALGKVSFTIHPEDIKGEQIEDRGSQITFSALGQNQSVKHKDRWDPNHAKRKEMLGFLSHLKKDFDVKIGGTTSIDITLKGMDKAFGIREYYRHTGLNIKRGLFIGDKIIPGGNDFAATQTGIDTRSTAGPEETKKIIREMLGSYN